MPHRPALLTPASGLLAVSLVTPILGPSPHTQCDPRGGRGPRYRGQSHAVARHWARHRGTDLATPPEPALPRDSTAQAHDGSGARRVVLVGQAEQLPQPAQLRLEHRL